MTEIKKKHLAQKVTIEKLEEFRELKEKYGIKPSRLMELLIDIAYNMPKAEFMKLWQKYQTK